VLARRATLRYRVTKFVTRNKALAAAGALGSLVLIGGVAGVAWQARIARSERARAVRRFNDVRELANSFIFELHDAIRDLPGATSARALLVKRALHYLDSLASESAGDASLQRELAAAYLRLGDVQGKPFEPNLGDTPGSMASYRKSAAIGEALLLAGHAEARRGLADAYGRIGDALAIQGDVGGATASLRQGLQLREALLAEAPRDRALTLDLALSHGRVADRLANLGDVKAALDSRRKALDLLTSLTASAPADRELSERLGVAQQKLANNLGNPSFVNVGDTRAALENLEAAGSTFRGLLASDPKSAKLQRLVAVNLSNVSDVLDAQSDHGLALERQRRSLEFFQALADADPKDAQARSDVAVSCSKVGYLLSEIGDLAGAEASYLRALGIHRALSESDPSNASEREEVGVVLNRLGETLSLKGDLAGGLLQQQRAHAIIAALSQADPMNQMLRLSLAGACSAVGEAEAGIAAAGRDTKAAQAARWSEASVWYDKALGILGDLRAKGVLTGSDAGEPERVLALRETAGRALSASPRAR
jgi:tetratricopeptide (TPR) repeat protein